MGSICSCGPDIDQFSRKYELGETIGSGHFATVHLCYPKNNPEKKFAVKVINKTELVSLDLLSAEVKILKQVGDHPNILTLIDTFDKTNEFLIITEFCRGGDLFGRIVETGNCSESHAIHIMKQLFSAMQHIHSCGVTHRDLKPENILLLTKDEDSIIKVADFGLSKLKNENDGEKIMKTVCGTWAYCAPEVIRRKPYTHLVDNWTLGILMFVILSGYHPFDMYGDATEATLLTSIDTVKYDFDDEVWEKISDDAKKIIQNLLQKDPEKRKSCAELLETDWVTGKVTVSKEINPKVLANITRLDKMRKKLKVTVTTVAAASKFKRMLKNTKLKLKMIEQKNSKVAWDNKITNIVPKDN